MVSFQNVNAKLLCRVYNYDALTQLKNVRANCYGKYIALRGTVVRVSNIKPLCTKLAFVCGTCGDVQSVPLPDGKYTLPTKVSIYRLTSYFSLICSDLTKSSTTGIKEKKLTFKGRLNN